MYDYPKIFLVESFHVIRQRHPLSCGDPDWKPGRYQQRALDTLSAVDWVVSEDTRKTGFLLKAF